MSSGKKRKNGSKTLSKSSLSLLVEPELPKRHLNVALGRIYGKNAKMA
jgi:hypothetical protein